MGFSVGKSAVILSDQFDITAFFNSLNCNHEVGSGETTVFGNNDRNFLATLKGGNLSAEGFGDFSSNAIDQILNAALGVAAGQIITVGFAGLTVGNRVRVCKAKETRYSLSQRVDGVVTTGMDVMADGGLLPGVSLHALAAETASSNSASVDNLVATTGGGVTNLHLTAVTAVGGDSLTVTIEDSADNSIWATIATFTVLTTAVTSEQLAIAGTIRRYVRSKWVKGGVGTPSYTFAVSLARK